MIILQFNAELVPIMRENSVGILLQFNILWRQKECGHIVEASVVIQKEKEEATHSVANNFKLSKGSDKDKKESPARSNELTVLEEEKVCKTTVVGTIVEDLKLNSYSKNDLITIIEFSLLSYIEESKQPSINHLCSREKPNKYIVEVRVFKFEK